MKLTDSETMVGIQNIGFQDIDIAFLGLCSSLTTITALCAWLAKIVVHFGYENLKTSLTIFMNQLKLVHACQGVQLISIFGSDRQ